MPPRRAGTAASAITACSPVRPRLPHTVRPGITAAAGVGSGASGLVLGVSPPQGICSSSAFK